MKKLVFLFSALLLLASCGKSGFKVTVEFEDNDKHNGKEAFLVDYDSGDTIASATIEDQKCVLESDIDSTFSAILYFDDLYDPLFQFIVEPGEIVAKFPKDSDFTVTSPLNDMKREKMSNIKISAGEKPLLKLYQENKDNIIGSWAFCEYIFYNEELEKAEFDSLLMEAPAEYAHLKRVEKAKTLFTNAEQTAEGKKFVDFEATDVNGKTFKLSDYVGKGKPVAMVFFNPSWEYQHGMKDDFKMLNDWKHDNAIGSQFELVCVPAYDTPENIRQCASDNNVNYPIVISNQTPPEPFELYGFRSHGFEGVPIYISYTIVFDPEGTIYYRGASGQIKLMHFIDVLAGSK